MDCENCRKVSERFAHELSKHDAKIALLEDAIFALERWRLAARSGVTLGDPGRDADKVLEKLKLLEGR